MKRKTISKFILVGLCVFALAGCGKQEQLSRRHQHKQQMKIAVLTQQAIPTKCLTRQL